MWEDCQVLQWKLKWLREVGWGTSRGVAHDAIGPCSLLGGHRIGTSCVPTVPQPLIREHPPLSLQWEPQAYLAQESGSPQGISHRNHGCLLFLPPLLTPPNLSVHTSGHPEPGRALAAHPLVSEGPSGPCSSVRSATSGLPSRREVALSLGWPAHREWASEF